MDLVKVHRTRKRIQFRGQTCKLPRRKRWARLLKFCPLRLPKPSKAAPQRFLFVKTLRRPHLPDYIPFPKRQWRLPTILDQQEVARLIDSAGNLMHRTMLMMLYATGLRRAKMCHLKVSDIDSKRMVIHVRQGNGGRDRDVLLPPPKLLETLREYWRWMKPKTYLFSGTVKGRRADVPITQLADCAMPIPLFRA